MTNAELVRLEAGDTGVPTRDVSSGDGASVEFYVSSPPLRADTQVVKVSGVTFTEVPTTPGANEYTLDDEAGRIVFGVAPANAIDNVVVTYHAVSLLDAHVTEALRLYGLTAGATADPGPTAALLHAAALACDWQASRSAGEFDFTTDGQDFKKGSLAHQWGRRAEAIRARARRMGGIVSSETSRIDGYTRRGEHSGREVATVASPRRAYYGEQDVIP